jgi:hypothetical protein
MAHSRTPKLKTAIGPYPRYHTEDGARPGVRGTRTYTVTSGTLNRGIFMQRSIWCAVARCVTAAPNAVLRQDGWQ